MPSDARVEAVIEAQAPAIQRYRSTVGATLQEIRSYLTRATAAGDDRGEIVAAELGPFAAGRIDLDSFSRLVGDSTPIDPAMIRAVREACRLVERAMQDDRLFHTTVKPGGTLGETVGRAFQRAGRLLAAARLVAQVKTSGHLPSGNGLGPLGFEYWSAGERRLAPPLIVRLEGPELCAGELARYLDVGIRIVLVVEGPCPPAPLVRLITPGTLVIQTSEPAELGPIAAADGPAVGALVPESAARFIHDPAGGLDASARVTLIHVPEESSDLRRIGGIGASQQREELDQLRALAEPPAPASERVEAREGTAASDPADKLAAWLLNRADLGDLE